MPATTIFAAFSEAMPKRKDPILKPPEAHVSGPSTKVSDAPKLGLRLHSFFAPFATELICDPLKDSYLATWEETRRLIVEADVSDAASPQLINPVDLALAANHPKEIYHLNQEYIQNTYSDSARVDKS